MDKCNFSAHAGRYGLHVAAFLLLAYTQSVFAQPDASQRDYLLPGESRGGFTSTPSKAESAQQNNQKSASVSYVAFDGASYQLQPRAGRYVTLLLPLAANGTAPFTEDHIEELIDRLDVLYADYRNLMQAEPAGAGSLNVAFVTSTCSIACGQVGAKGIEVARTDANYADIIADLDAGKLHNFLNHEMAHNFDLYSTYLSYLPDHAHAWTAIFEFFAPYRYARGSNDHQLADDLYQSAASFVWQPYMADKTASWEKCVRDQLCHASGLYENSLWAMIYYRIEKLHGKGAIEASFAYLKNYAKSNQPPATTQDKEDLRLMSLAVGAGVNISCYLHDLKWVVSPKLNSDMQARFGSSNPLCGDNDKDGYSMITGDCDDHDSARSPGLEELMGNGVDEDCDGILDESELMESNGYDIPGYSSALAQNMLPLEVRGRMSSLQDRDDVKVSLPANGRVRVKLCRDSGFSGWVAALQPNGQFLKSQFWFEYLDVAGCSIGTFDFGSLDSGVLEVQPDKTTGDYSLTVSAAEDMPKDLSPLLEVVPRASGGMNVVVRDPDGILASLGANSLEVWISGLGISLTAPYKAVTTIALNAASAAQLNPGSLYQARLRPLKNGKPLASYSAGHLFRYDAVAPATAPPLDDVYSGAWFDPSHEGEGFIVEVMEHGQALVYWFTYAADGSQRWMLGMGKVQGNSIIVDELLHTSGGQFGNNFDPKDVVFDTLGSLSITFGDCTHATVNYSVNQIGDHQSLQRLSSVYGHRCGKASESVSSDFSGSWFDPAHEGEGFIVEQLSASQALVFWFSYTSEGEQAWMLATGSIADGYIRTDDILQPAGGQFGRSFNPASVALPIWGNLEMQLDCSAGDASYTSDLTAFADGSQQLKPLTRLAHSSCKL